MAACGFFQYRIHITHQKLGFVQQSQQPLPSEITEPKMYPSEFSPN